MKDNGSNDQHAASSDGGPAPSEDLVSSVVAYRRGQAEQPATHVAPVVPAVGAPEGEIQVSRMILAALRGRVIVVVLLGVVTGAMAAVATWRLAKPRYESDGLVRIRYSLPEVMQETDQNKPMPMYDTFMQSQKLLITSRAVLDNALIDPVWKAMGRSLPLEPERYFAKHLVVDIKPRSEYIQIAVQDEDPTTAAAAVNAIINSYGDRYKLEEERLSKERLGVLSDKERTLQLDVEKLSKDLAEASKAFGTAKLDMIYDAAAARWTRAETALADVRVAIATAAGRPQAATDASTSQPASGTDAATPEELAMTDSQMRACLDARERALAMLKHLRRSYLEEHEKVIEAKADVEDAEARIKRYLPLALAARDAARARGRSGELPIAALSLQALKQNEANLVILRDDALRDMRQYGEQRSKLEALSADLNTKRTELERVQQRLNSIRNETLLGGRLNVVSTGEVPLTPSRELRLYATPAAALGGLCLPAALVVLGTCVTRRKFRYSDDAAEHAPLGGKLLGILPALDEAELDGEAMGVAAHTVHQIRVTLRSQADDEGSHAYLVTSSAAGDGKTSLVMSLAFSFAASGARTLIVDCDLVGRHLSHNLGVTHADGFNEALKNKRLQKLVRRAGPNLYVMSAGRAADFDACGISATKVRAILAEAKRYFEVVLIDSGPILGSVEAAVLAQEVDGVVFAVARGQDRDLVDRSVRRLQGLGGRIEGYVFNRAEARDFRRSAYSSSSQMTAPSSSGAEGRRRLFAADRTNNRFAEFGPLIQAMLASVPEAFQSPAAQGAREWPPVGVP